MIRHLCDNIVQVYSGIYLVRLTCGQQRTYDRHINRSFVITTEEKIFSAQSDGALDVFRQIVIPVQATIVQASYNIIPFGIGICNGLACQRTWTVFNP